MLLRGKCGRLYIVGVKFIIAVIVAAPFCCHCCVCFRPLPCPLLPPSLSSCLFLDRLAMGCWPRGLHVVGLIFIVRPHLVAIEMFAFGRCPAPSCRHHYLLVDCWIICATDATLLASYSLLSLLVPHFCIHSPFPPFDCRLCAAFLGRVPSSGDTGIRVRALKGVPAAVVVGRTVTDDGNGHSPLWHSYS